MATLTTPYEAFEKPGLVVNYKLSNVKVLKGGMVGINSAGYIQPMAHGTSSLKFIGVCNETIDNTTGAAGDKSANVTKCGSFVMKAVTGYVPSITDLGKEVYANTDWEVQISTSGLSNSYKVGTIVGIETTSTGSSGVRVRVDNYSV